MNHGRSTRISLSRTAWLWLLPVSLASVVAYQPAGSSTPWSMLLGIGLVAQAILGMTWWVVRQISPSTPAAVLGCVLGAATRSTATGVLSWLAGSGATVWERFVPGTVIFSIASLLVCWGVTTRRATSMEHGRLLLDRDVCTREVIKLQEAIGDLRHTVRQRIEAGFTEEQGIDRILDRLLPEVVQDLRVPPSRTRNVTDALQSLLRDDPFPVAWVSVAMVALCATAAVMSLGPVSAIALLLALGGCIEVLIRIARWTAPWRATLGGSANAAVVVTLWIMIAAAAGGILMAFPAALERWQNLPLVIALLTLAFEVAFAGVASARRQALIARTALSGEVLALNAERQFLEGQLAAERSRLRRLVHGELQSRLTAARLAAGTKRQVSVDSVAVVVGDFLTRIDGPAPQRRFSESLEDLTQVWDRACHITCSGADLVDPMRAHAMTAICEEAIANAVVHGKATAIDIRVRADTPDSGLEVTIAADGLAPAPNVRPGTGMAIFAEFSRDFCLRAGESNGSVLLAHIA